MLLAVAAVVGFFLGVLPSRLATSGRRLQMTKEAKRVDDPGGVLVSTTVALIVGITVGQVAALAKMHAISVVAAAVLSTLAVWASMIPPELVKWKPIGPVRPLFAGLSANKRDVDKLEVVNGNFAAAIQTKVLNQMKEAKSRGVLADDTVVDFTGAQLDMFEVSGLQEKSFIKAGDTYFQLVALPGADMFTLHSRLNDGSAVEAVHVLTGTAETTDAKGLAPTENNLNPGQVAGMDQSWERVEDPFSPGDYYWWNPSTGDTTWDEPQLASRAAPPPLERVEVTADCGKACGMGLARLEQALLLCVNPLMGVTHLVVQNVGPTAVQLGVLLAALPELIALWYLAPWRQDGEIAGHYATASPSVSSKGAHGAAAYDDLGEPAAGAAHLGLVEVMIEDLHVAELTVDDYLGLNPSIYLWMIVLICAMVKLGDSLLVMVTVLKLDEMIPAKLQQRMKVLDGGIQHTVRGMKKQFMAVVEDKVSTILTVTSEPASSKAFSAGPATPKCLTPYVESVQAKLRSTGSAIRLSPLKALVVIVELVLIVDHMAVGGTAMTNLALNFATTLFLPNPCSPRHGGLEGLFMDIERWLPPGRIVGNSTNYQDRQEQNQREVGDKVDCANEQDVPRFEVNEETTNLHKDQLQQMAVNLAVPAAALVATSMAMSRAVRRSLCPGELERFDSSELEFAQEEYQRISELKYVDSQGPDFEKQVQRSLRATLFCYSGLVCVMMVVWMMIAPLHPGFGAIFSTAVALSGFCVATFALAVPQPQDFSRFLSRLVFLFVALFAALALGLAALVAPSVNNISQSGDLPNGASTSGAVADIDTSNVKLAQDAMHSLIEYVHEAGSGAVELNARLLDAEASAPDHMRWLWNAVFGSFVALTIFLGYDLLCACNAPPNVEYISLVEDEEAQPPASEAPLSRGDGSATVKNVSPGVKGGLRSFPTPKDVITHEKLAVQSRFLPPPIHLPPPIDRDTMWQFSVASECLSGRLSSRTSASRVGQEALHGSARCSLTSARSRSGPKSNRSVSPSSPSSASRRSADPAPATEPSATPPRTCTVTVKMNAVVVLITLDEKLLRRPLSTALVTPFLRSYNEKLGEALGLADVLSVTVDGRRVPRMDGLAGELFPNLAHRVELKQRQPDDERWQRPGCDSSTSSAGAGAAAYVAALHRSGII
jgi:preprotein translocase subunit SecG